jgi:hypothetical protein
LVEAIVAAMHRGGDVKVEQNVRMPVIDDAKRTSEIDVLLTGTAGGYAVKIAFECKNEERPVGTPKINTFIGKLQDVGIPTQHGIFVAAKGYTRGAIARAKKAGMQTLVLTGLSTDRLSAAMRLAFNATIDLWLEVEEVSITTSATSNSAEELGAFYDEDRDLVGLLPDLIWRQWRTGQIPAIAGEHHVVLQLPVGWRQIIQGAESIPDTIHATVHVHALVITESGPANRHDLVDAATGQISRVRVAFNPNHASARAFSTEDELSRYLDQTLASVKLTARSRLPRILWKGILWPPSLRLINGIEASRQSEADPSTIKLADLDPLDYARMWEPVWHSPMLEGILKARFTQPFKPNGD